MAELYKEHKIGVIRRAFKTDRFLKAKNIEINQNTASKTLASLYQEHGLLKNAGVQARDDYLRTQYNRLLKREKLLSQDYPELDDSNNHQRLKGLGLQKPATLQEKEAFVASLAKQSGLNTRQVRRVPTSMNYGWCTLPSGAVPHNAGFRQYASQEICPAQVKKNIAEWQKKVANQWTGQIPKPRNDNQNSSIKQLCEIKPGCSNKLHLTQLLYYPGSQPFFTQQVQLAQNSERLSISSMHDWTGKQIFHSFLPKWTIPPYNHVLYVYTGFPDGNVNTFRADSP